MGHAWGLAGEEKSRRSDVSGFKVNFTARLCSALLNTISAPRSVVIARLRPRYRRLRAGHRCVPVDAVTTNWPEPGGGGGGSQRSVRVRPGNGVINALRRGES